MALINIHNVQVLDNPTQFTNPFQFEITFECLHELPEDLEWKVIYVGSAEDATFDQELENVMVGPVGLGIHKFVLQAPAPSVVNIANQDLIGVTVVLVTCSYLDHEFVRIGYYVNNEYSEPYEEGTLPDPIEISKLYRNILAAEPRVTRFNIDWNIGGVPVVDDGANAGIAGTADMNTTAVGDDDDALDLDKMGDGDDEEASEEDDEGDDDAEVDLGDEEEDGEGEGDGDDVDTSGVDMVIHQEDSMDVHVMQQGNLLLQ